MAIIISKNGKGAKRVDPSPFEREDHLQEYIYQNPDCIPLYEIKEDIRLLILAREFPTASGPIDAVGIDGDGELYLVETKLYKNPDKRLVVAQVLDYGASLWAAGGNFDQFVSTIEEEVSKTFGVGLNQKLKEFFGIDSDEEVSALRENLRTNLNKGNFKFVVLMDKLHSQLRDLIVFINANSRFDIFAVEIEYYKHEDYEIVIPKLFGAEVKKDTAVASPSGTRRKWDEASFFEDARQQLDETDIQAVRELYEFSKRTADEIKWGSGMTRGSFNPVFFGISAKSLFTVRSLGSLTFNFQWLNNGDVATKYNDRLKTELEKTTALRFPKDYQDRFVTYSIEQWRPSANEIVHAIQNLVQSLKTNE